MKQLIKNWITSKSIKQFSYEEALKSLINTRSIINQSPILDTLHFSIDTKDIIYKTEITISNKIYIKKLLDYINFYFYYLRMNEELKNLNHSNKKKLKKFNEILNDDFINFLDVYLELDKTISTCKQTLKIQGNYTDVIKNYLKDDFKFSLNRLEQYLESNTKATNSLSVKDEEMINSELIKPNTTTFLQPLSKKAILKCLHYDLLYNFDNINKEQSLEIIETFFEVKLQNTKIEHSFSSQAIRDIKEKKKNISNEHKEIKEIHNIKKALKDNFHPTVEFNNLSSHHKTGTSTNS